ncbi:MAG: hypothetical protein H7Z14_15505 [Anaerolineae bacterium]|nr:hypothetical protein [Phycisphaerae bacterium]
MPLSPDYDRFMALVTEHIDVTNEIVELLKQNKIAEADIKIRRMDEVAQMIRDFNQNGGRFR